MSKDLLDMLHAGDEHRRADDASAQLPDQSDTDSNELHVAQTR